MSHSYSIDEPVRGGPVVAAGQTTVLWSLARMIAIWLDRRQGRQDLRELDDRLLSDVGISREEALREARKPFWRTEHAPRKPLEAPGLAVLERAIGPVER